MAKTRKLARRKITHRRRVQKGRGQTFGRLGTPFRTKDLYTASIKGNLSDVKRLIAAGADVNKEHFGLTPLYGASKNGYLEIVERLIAAGADVNKSQTSTPLFIASYMGHLNVVERLIAAGADVNKARAYTPLYIACENGYLEIVERLITAGADVNKAHTDDGSTPLYIASRYGMQYIVERLIAAGADINKADNVGATPLYIASRYGFLYIVEQLLAAGADKTIRARDGKLPIDVAITEKIRKLLRDTVVNLFDNAATLNTIDIPVPNVEAASNALLGDLAEDNVVGYFPNANGKIFASQGITAYRKTDPTTPTNLWSGTLESGQNPFTRQPFVGAPVYRRAHLVKTEGGRRIRRGTRNHNRS